MTLLGLGVVPVINENDTVVNDEIKFGDNDTLGALVANLLDADALVILTDQAGLFSADPRKDPTRALGRARRRRRSRRSSAWPAAPAQRIGRGGMLTKILAAKRAARSGASTVIASGPRARRAAAPGRRRERSAPLLVATTPKVAARKHWMSDHLQLRGAVVVDDGAAAKLRDGGKSLLPIGVVERRGRLPSRRRHRRARARSGEEIGRGLGNYGSAEARLIARKPSSRDRAACSASPASPS